jgi:hypothetical protein
MKVLIVGSIAILVGAIMLAFGIGMAEDVDESRLRTHALVTWYDVGAPLGRFLLLRKDSSLCAIRFTEFHRGNDAKSPTVFSSGEESLDAKYECFCQSDRGGGFGGATLGRVDKRASWGIGRFAFSSGDTNIRCGGFKLPWMYPTRVSFHIDGTKLGDQGIELAPTRWSAINEVNVTDAKLRWFRYDENRKVTYIPIGDL